VAQDPGEGKVVQRRFGGVQAIVVAAGLLLPDGERVAAWLGRCRERHSFRQRLAVAVRLRDRCGQVALAVAAFELSQLLSRQAQRLGERQRSQCGAGQSRWPNAALR